ncbi:MAG: PaaX domain-containing protein, C- domain protein [Marmoricola sp.]
MKVRPLSARSVVLSLLLGAHPPELAVRDLVTVVQLFGITEPTLRVALTRMVAAGDLERTDAMYRLSARMLERQQRQDTALESAGRAWDGTWETVVVTSGGRSAGDRAGLRTRLTSLRLAELREGVWMRPANLARPLPSWPADLLVVLRSTPEDDPVELAGRLWDLPAWNSYAGALLAAVSGPAEPAARLAIAAALVRHLRTDPALPAELLPADWCAADLRAAYTTYQAELVRTGLNLNVSPAV